MFTAKERDALRKELLDAARADPRITGAALTGSASVDKEDRWSDVDLAFGVRERSEVEAALADYSARMYRDHRALHHLDVISGSWIYRVFILPSTLQVDLAFAPAEEFGARGPTFRLVFGAANPAKHSPPASAEELIGWAWLYALHARSSIARGKLWQAEYMVSGMRDQVLALACVRHGLPAREARGIDDLPQEITAPLRDGLVRSIDATELLRAFRTTTLGLVREIQYVDPVLCAHLEKTLYDLNEV
jgi:hypothetical protein